MVVDSSVWIEIFLGGPLAGKCETALARDAEARVPTLVLFEVYRKISRIAGEDAGLEVVAALRKRGTIELDDSIALLAGDISNAEGLPMADSIVLAHARALGTKLLTLDNDFAKITDARVLRNEGPRGRRSE